MEKNKITVRHTTAADAALIADLSRTTFYQAFAKIIPKVIWLCL